VKDRVLSRAEWQMQWLARLPHPLPATVWSDGAACPWCGSANATVTYEVINNCCDCERPFWFSIPPWADDTQLYTWVHPTAKDQQLLDKNPTLFPLWEPNDRLKEIYFRLKTSDMEAGHS
jgi:hypothetical protein